MKKSERNRDVVQGLTYKFRVYPTKSQGKIISKQLEICRQIYNRTLERRIEEYKNTKTTLSLPKCNKELTQWKKLDKQISLVHSQSLQNIQDRVELAFQGFFRRVKLAKSGEKPGFPKFKDEGKVRSITYTQSGYKILGKHIELSKIGKIKTVFHRKIVGEIRRVSIVKYASGKYYICISVEQPRKTIYPDANYQHAESIGIDLGSRKFVTLSDGSSYNSPKFLQKSKQKLEKIERQGKSKARIEEKISNQRHDFIHKLANTLVKKYKVICLENLDVKNIIKKGFSREFRKTILDNGWATFINVLSYKAVMAGVRIVLINPAYTSQTCSRCGKRRTHKLTLHNKIFECDSDPDNELPSCGYSGCRDHNASIVILQLGIKELQKNNEIGSTISG